MQEFKDLMIANEQLKKEKQKNEKNESSFQDENSSDDENNSSDNDNDNGNENDLNSVFANKINQFANKENINSNDTNKRHKIKNLWVKTNDCCHLPIGFNNCNFNNVNLRIIHY